MSDVLDDARDVDVDIEEAWTITVAGLHRRRRARRAGYAVAVGMVLLAAVAVASLVTTGEERVGVSVQPDPPTTVAPSCGPGRERVATGFSPIACVRLSALGGPDPALVYDYDERTVLGYFTNGPPGFVPKALADRVGIPAVVACGVANGAHSIGRGLPGSDEPLSTACIEILFEWGKALVPALNLQEIDRGWEKYRVIGRVAVQEPGPLQLPANGGRRLSLEITKATNAPLELGSGNTVLSTYLTDLDGRIVGGSAAGVMLAGPGRDYPTLDGPEHVTVEASVNALEPRTDGSDPLPPGRYLLWLDLPRPDGAKPAVAGPLQITVTVR